MFALPHMFGCPHVWTSLCMVGCPHMFGHPSICLDALHMFSCPTVCLDAAKCMVVSKGMRDIQTYGECPNIQVGIQTYGGIQTYRRVSKHMAVSKHGGILTYRWASKHMGYPTKPVLPLVISILWNMLNLSFILSSLRWVPLEPDFLGAWKSVQLKCNPAYPIIIISLIIHGNLAKNLG